MKKSILKKSIAFILAAMLIFIMAACGAKENPERAKEGKETEEAENTTEDVKEVVYEETDFALAGVEGDVYKLCVKGDRLYLLTKEGEMNEEGIIEGPSVIRVYSANKDGSDVNQILLRELEEREYVNYFMVGSDNNIMYMIQSEKDGKLACYMVRTDGQGNETAREEVSDYMEIVDDSYISGYLQITADNNNRVIIINNNTVSVLDENFKSLFEVESDSYIEGAAITKDGQVVCCTSGEDGLQVQVLDIEQKKWSESYPLGIRTMQWADGFMDGLEYDFYFKNEYGIYGFDMNTQKLSKIVDFLASNIDGNSLLCIAALEKEKFVGNEDLDSEACLTAYNKIDSSDVAEKQAIVVGVLYYLDESVKEEVMAFNKENEKYRIEVKEYSNQSEMSMDIITGKAPDIISLYGLPFSQYAAKGLLEDLTPYFDKDSELNTSDILDSVLEAMKTDDKLYYISPDFRIATIIASAEDVGTEPGWTVEDMKALLDEKGEDIKPFYSENKLDILETLLVRSTSDFIDWQTGECTFDSQDFKDILEFCNADTNEELEYNEDDPSLYALIKEGKVLFMEGWTTLNDIQFAKKLYGGDITYIGYPNKDKDGSYFSFTGTMGIYSNSEVKDGAWEFLRTFMTKEYQGMQENITPTRKDCFDLMIKQKTATEPYTDEFGREIQPVSESFGGDLDMELKPFSQEEIEFYKSLVDNTKKVEEENEFVMDIIREEVKAYFAGDKSVDDTADIIQNRVTTYVNENR